MSLRRRADFLSVQKKGKRISPERWLVINYIYNDVNQLRCGWTIPGKVGTAVTRNRLKRWCRVITQNVAKARSLNSIDLNVFIRPVDAEFFKRLKFVQFKEAMERGLSSIRTNS